MASNGNLPQSDLAAISGGGYLRKDAAAAWNAMAAEIRNRTGTQIRVNGPDSAYRTYARQVYWKNYWCSRGACQNAATPGTSNHGWGIAVDVPEFTRALIASYGKPFGWDRACSDAPWESWHHKWCGGWSGGNPGAGGSEATKYPVLKKGKEGGAVKRAQKHLRRWNLGMTRPKADGGFGEATKKAVNQFQRVHNLKPDGVVGPKTWKKLRQKDHFLDDERRALNLVRLIGSGGKTNPKELAQVTRLRRFLALRAKSIARVSAEHGWKEMHRRERFKTLKRAAGGQFDEVTLPKKESNGGKKKPDGKDDGKGQKNRKRK